MWSQPQKGYRNEVGRPGACKPRPSGIGQLCGRSKAAFGRSLLLGSIEMDELYGAIECEVMGLLHAVWNYRTEDNPDLGYWQPVAEMPMPYLDNVVQRCPRWRLALEQQLQTALARWPRSGMPFETLAPRLCALREATLALVNENVGAEGGAWDRWLAATSRIQCALNEVRDMAVAAGQRTEANPQTAEHGQGGGESPDDPVDLATGESSCQDARHSRDFRSVHWFGTNYTFTAKQAACVKILWQEWENGTPEISNDALLAEAEVETKRLDHLFDYGKHPAWGSMIQPGTTKGTSRLSPPQDE
jgi:hypothetical protein